MGMREKRIDGWKSIASYLERDRSTVIRWARERGLPVHSLPGGRTRSVFALAAELDRWMLASSDETEADPVDAPPPPPSDTADVRAGESDQPARWRTALIGALALAAIGAPYLPSVFADQPAAVALDPASMAKFVRARDDVAARSTTGLGVAIATLTRLRQRYPAHVGTHEALAEAWLLAREFGSVPDSLAFERSVAEARALRGLDPGSTVADRVEAVAAYWWDRDPSRAGVIFRRAIARSPRDQLAHLWYANILADNGEDAAASREFTAARLLAPGVPYLLADYGWGLWAAGQTAAGEQQLNALAAIHPELASVQDCVSVMALARGDIATYARHLRERARARNEAELIAYSNSLDRAVSDGSRDLAFSVMISRALAFAQGASHPDHSWPAFVASTAGQREQLLGILRQARARGERWGAAGYVRRIAARWAGDAQIRTTLDALRQARVEPL